MPLLHTYIDANEGQLALYSGVSHNTKPVTELRRRKKKKKNETVICEICSEIAKLKIQRKHTTPFYLQTNQTQCI